MVRRSRDSMKLLSTQLDGRFPIALHGHTAVLYRGRATAFRLAPFLSEGLARGDRCVYLAPEDFHPDMLQQLRCGGGDPDAHVQSGALRLQRGLSEFRALREWTQQVYVDAENAKAPAVRWLEEGIWPRPLGFPIADFFEFHALLNYQVKHYPSAVVCQYALEGIEPRHLFTAIAVHRNLLVENTLVRDNPFYIPAERFIPLSPEERVRDLTSLFRDVGFDVDKLLAAIAGYGRLRVEPAEGARP